MDAPTVHAQVPGAESAGASRVEDAPTLVRFDDHVDVVLEEEGNAVDGVCSSSVRGEVKTNRSERLECLLDGAVEAVGRGGMVAGLSDAVGGAGAGAKGIPNRGRVGVGRSAHSRRHRFDVDEITGSSSCQQSPFPTRNTELTGHRPVTFYPPDAAGGAVAEDRLACEFSPSALLYFDGHLTRMVSATKIPSDGCPCTTTCSASSKLAGFGLL